MQRDCRQTIELESAGIGPVEKADAVCRERGLPFTAPRRSVLEILLKQDRPISAYDVLRQMQQACRPPGSAADGIPSPRFSGRATLYLQDRKQKFVRTLCAYRSSARMRLFHL